MPAVTHAQTVAVSLETYDGFFIDKRAFYFVFQHELLITDVYPTKGSLEGGYEFTLTGNF